jgi:uncharacterized protein YdiU (UPF0061 family)
MPTIANTFVHELPGDPSAENRPRQVHGAAYTRVRPTPVAAPRVLATSREMVALLGLDPADPDFASVFAGNALYPGMEPYSAAYGGHQFGNWAGQLGDGRAITLGEWVATDGSRQELQLKGAGPTPYSRTADGRAVLRSSVREFLCSEAMHHLGVPTTRALSLVATGEPVLRDMFYDGHAEHEPGAVVCRVAPSFLRFGSYQLPASRGDVELLADLVAYTLRHFWPELGEPTPDAVLAMLHDVARRTVATVTHWMRVGFVHGVMNTDNLSILGLTIDYGPYGWLEPYDPDWTPNTTDAQGRRYRYGNQPAVALWNLARLAEALFPLIGDEDALGKFLLATRDQLGAAQLAMLRSKLGLQGEQPGDESLIRSLFALLGVAEVDMTLFFRGLAEGELEAILPAWYAEPSAPHREQATRWLAAWNERVGTDPGRKARMNAVNPKYVLRNWLAQLAIDRAAAGDSSGIDELLDVLLRPYDDQPGKDEFAAKRPEWARHRAGCSMLSCSS